MRPENKRLQGCKQFYKSHVKTDARMDYKVFIKTTDIPINPPLKIERSGI
jgi:hypothetical protein